jgi:hypothetical protein
MRRITFVAASAVLALCSLGSLGIAQSPKPTIYISPDGGFQTALTAALFKKHVPATVITDESKAKYILKAAPVDSKSESGAGKIARCMFADCIGINGNSEVSVQLLQRDSGAVVWAYQVKKGNAGPRGIQSLSEAVAKHLNNDFLKKQK